MKTLAAHEPSNAETLARAIDHAHRLQLAYDKIAGSTPLLQPVIAVADAWHDPDGDKAAVWVLSWRSYVPQIDLGLGAMLYGFCGLMAGSLAAQLLRALFEKAARTGRRARHGYVPSVK